jgi:ElaB/YqjD/DUF883 family membrane-anchored ribosome-binding protein
MGIEEELQKQIEEAKAKAADLEKEVRELLDEGESFVKKNRYFFIAGAFALGALIGLMLGQV